jgi:hypothetical protein
MADSIAHTINAANRSTVRRAAEILIEEVGLERAQAIAERITLETSGTQSYRAVVEALYGELQNQCQAGQGQRLELTAQ